MDPMLSKVQQAMANYSEQLTKLCDAGGELAVALAEFYEVAHEATHLGGNLNQTVPEQLPNFVTKMVKYHQVMSKTVASATVQVYKRNVMGPTNALVGVFQQVREDLKRYRKKALEYDAVKTEGVPLSDKCQCAESVMLQQKLKITQQLDQLHARRLILLQQPVVALFACQAHFHQHYKAGLRQFVQQTPSSSHYICELAQQSSEEREKLGVSNYMSALSFSDGNQSTGPFCGALHYPVYDSGVTGDGLRESAWKTISAQASPQEVRRLDGNMFSEFSEGHSLLQTDQQLGADPRNDRHQQRLPAQSGSQGSADWGMGFSPRSEVYPVPATSGASPYSSSSSSGGSSSSSSSGSSNRSGQAKREKRVSQIMHNPVLNVIAPDADGWVVGRINHVRAETIQVDPIDHESGWVVGIVDPKNRSETVQVDPSDADDAQSGWVVGRVDTARDNPRLNSIQVANVPNFHSNTPPELPPKPALPASIPGAGASGASMMGVFRSSMPPLPPPKPSSFQQFPTGTHTPSNPDQLDDFGDDEEFDLDAGGGGGVVAVAMAEAFALYDYDGVNRPGHLSFKTGDLIVVLEKPPSGWWNGKCNGAVGIFPSEFCSLEIAAIGTV
jgi:hypothetical protein